MSSVSEADYILALSNELLDDIELDRLPAEKLLLKANRLARFAGSDEVQKWLNFELQGYVSNDEISLRYMSLTGRWTNYEEKKGYWGPLGQHEAGIDANKARMAATTINSLSGDYSLAVFNRVNQEHHSINLAIGRLSGVRSRVLGLLHNFVAGVYHARQFADVAERTFEGYKKEVDALLAEKAGDVLTKMPSVVARLKEEDPEAVSHALVTCRRILEAFADAIFPPSDETIEIGGNTLKLDAGKHQNRINAFIAARTTSTSRRTRLRQNLSNLFDRVSTGVHSDVSPAEAYSLFLNVYLILGEVLHIPTSQPTAA